VSIYGLNERQIGSFAALALTDQKKGVEIFIFSKIVALVAGVSVSLPPREIPGFGFKPT